MLAFSCFRYLYTFFTFFGDDAPSLAVLIDVMIVTPKSFFFIFILVLQIRLGPLMRSAASTFVTEAPP